MNWKRIALTSVVFGLGVFAGVALAIFTQRKKSVLPKPWNADAIRATFSDVDTEGTKNNFVFHYTLENDTSFDYLIENAEHITLAGKLMRQQSLSTFGASDALSFPIFVPAKQRVMFTIKLVFYGYPGKASEGATSDQRQEYRAMIANYVKSEFTNLDGLTLLDDVNRYQIDFPPGWKLSK